ncbi:MAG TPA: DUF1549 domain-containing protein [Planctomycetaceae bacterium]|jgi:hypothetical protein|nr:DUF1549 domain-containing protein [Planctomycetaceae bacterium]
MVRRFSATGSFCRNAPLRCSRLASVLSAAAVLGGAANALLADSGGPLHERIDSLLQQVEAGAPSPLCGDSEFVRRLSIDLLGTLPTAAEVRRFLEDPSPNKRSYLVGRFLDHPRYAVHMARTFDVMLLERRNTEGIKQEDWERYLFDSFQADKPYDQLAREILTADGTDPKTRPAVKFYLERSGDPNLLTRDVGRIFFARDLQCCQCHDHPLIAHYYQADYYGLFAFLQRGYLTLDPTKPENKDKPVYFAEKAEGAAPATFQSVFDPKKAKHGTWPKLPGDPEIDEPYYPVGTEYQTAAASSAYPFPKYSRRSRFATEIEKGNLAFRRNIVNRLWAHMLGRGLFEPLDLDHPDNPPASPALLNLLADEFRSMGYDVKVFLREIALTSAYQRSFELPPDVSSGPVPPTASRKRFEAEAQRLSAPVKELEAQIKSAEGSLSPLKKASEAVGEELTNAEPKAAEVKKAFDAAAEAFNKTRADADARQFAAQALTEAAAKTLAASKRLPGDKPLAVAAATFQARASSLAAEATKLRETARAQDAALIAARRKLETEQQKLAQIAGRLSEAQSRLAPVARRLTDARTRRQGLLTRVNALKQAAAAAKSVEGYVSRRAAAAEAARAAEQARVRQALSQQLVSVRKSLASARESEGVLTRQLLQEENATANHQVVQASNADLVAAQQALAFADQQLTTAEARERALAGAADSELEVVSRNWSTRFSAAALKPLTPEQLAWNVFQVLGIAAQQRSAVEAELRKKNAQATPAQIEWETVQKLKGPVARFVSLFGSAAGQPQRGFFATVDQALFFSNGGELRSWLAPTPGNLCDRLLKLSDSRALADELYLSVVTRRPLPDEAAEVERYLAERPKDRSAAVQEIVWALLASSEFRFNH